MFTNQPSWSGYFRLVALVALLSFRTGGAGLVSTVSMRCHTLFPDTVGARPTRVQRVLLGVGKTRVEGGICGGGECDGVRYLGMFTKPSCSRSFGLVVTLPNFEM
jgi:hypothetical protein